ncbi:radical SAM protein [Lamprobacter modestohalophilus]|uniref:radical SAM protein n=1 Tax=Lamprobacter modestohalophilus TaxID=1064514 RepID=UPI002ADEBF2E|nr:radical SAM protein [Lamprobacter modestohalophilus]MEA1052781.1 radical SAM protein [Lamprobacter modestohalophilus]
MPVIIPTKRCDLRCTHCLRTDYKGEYLDPDILARFLSEFKEHSKQRTQHSFTGGEPTVHRDLEGLFAAFRDTGHSLYVITNGQNPQGVEKVIDSQDVVEYVSISLDAPVAEINDLTRGPETFTRATENASVYKEHGVDVDFRFVLHEGNIDTLEQAFELADRLGITRLRFSTLHPVAKAESSGMTVDNEILRSGYRSILELRRRFPKIKAGMNTRHMTPFLQPDWQRDYCTPIGGELNGLTLLPDGKISFCCDLVDNDFVDDRYPGENDWINPIIGDYKTQSLAEIKAIKSRRIGRLKRRRQTDFAEGNITGARVFICENCKFYHYKNRPQA